VPYNFFGPDAGPAWLQGIGFVILLALIMMGAFVNAIGGTMFFDLGLRLVDPRFLGNTLAEPKVS